MQNLTRRQNHQNQVKYAERYDWKGAFLRMALMILKTNKVKWMTFSCHSDTGLAIWVKKLEIGLNSSQEVRGSLFALGKLSMILFWLTWNMDPPLHCLIFCKISNFLIGRGCPMSKWPEKKIKLDLHAFIRLQNYQNHVRYARGYQWKGPFLKSVLIIIKTNKVQ